MNTLSTAVHPASLTTTSGKSEHKTDAALPRTTRHIEQAFIAREQARRRIALRSQLLLGIAGVLLFLLVWELAPRLVPGVNTKMFPPPSHIAKVFVDMTWGTGEIWPHVGASLLRALWGFLLGSSVGIVFGVLTGRIPWLRQLSDPVVHGLRAIPAIAIVPLAIVWFGLGDVSKVMLIAWGTFFPVWLNTFIGVRDLPPVYLRSAASLGASAWASLSPAAWSPTCYTAACSANRRCGW